MTEPIDPGPPESADVVPLGASPSPSPRSSVIQAMELISMSFEGPAANTRLRRELVRIGADPATSLEVLWHLAGLAAVGFSLVAHLVDGDEQTILQQHVAEWLRTFDDVVGDPPVPGPPDD